MSQQTEEMHQLSLVFNKNLDLLSQEVTIVPATIQNVQQIDKTKNEDPAELFLKELKYPCRLCRKEFTLGDHYIATKYELTQHTEIVHIRTVHQANDQTGRHEAVIKVDFSQKILLNMPEINILGSKPEHFNENTLVLATP